MIKPNIASLQSIPQLVKTFPVAPLIKSIPGLGGLFPGSIPSDPVSILDDSTNQVFTMARAMKINVSPTSKLMDHPIEDGSTRTDFRIINPIEIELSLICTGKDYKSVYQQIKTAWLSGDLFTVNSKADTYVRMMIASIPHDEISEMFDVISISIKMREVIIVETQYQPMPVKKVKHKHDQSTVHAGAVLPAAVPASVEANIATSVMNFFH